MSDHSDPLLVRFANHYGLDGRKLSVRAAYAAPNAVLDAGTDFAGPVQALRIQAYGRFGNNVYQVLTASVLARLLGIGEVELPELGPGTAPLPVETPYFRFVPHGAASGPVMSGIFYLPFGFERPLEQAAPAFVLETLQRAVAPLYGPLRDAASAVVAATRGTRTLAMHFRGGDVFGANGPQGVGAGYVQPPASYYLAAVRHAREELGTEAVVLIAEDDRNPAVAAVLASLTAQQVPVRRQTGSLVEDLATLMAADTIVGAVGTFSEAAALLSARTRHFYAFRRLGMIVNVGGALPPRLGRILRQGGIATYVVRDIAGDYIPEGQWTHSDAQRAAVVGYPQAALALQRLTDD